MRASYLSPFILPLLALLPVASLFAGCTDEDAVAPVAIRPDAGGTPCTPGTRACVCTNSGGCVSGLLCNSGRCLDTEGTPGGNDPDVRPTYRPPTPAQPDASVGEASDGGASSSDGG